MNGRMTDSEMARNLNLSVPAISKIRSKLENKGVIEGYQPIINMESVGVKFFTIALLKAKEKWWQDFGHDNSMEFMRKSAHMMLSVRCNEEEVAYIIVYSFRDAQEASDYFNEVQEKYYEYLEIRRLYQFSIKNMIKNSYRDMILKVISGNNKIVPMFKLFKQLVDEKKKKDKKGEKDTRDVKKEKDMQKLS
ncbi:winged helix-turn-helix transcriptional regulator [Candidatus Woesearchaeota archaeon]|nr:winged helix-turn-helix transcriptional regulator [Candidatus Woesearchaeota archaeon]